MLSRLVIAVLPERRVLTSGTGRIPDEEHRHHCSLKVGSGLSETRSSA